MYYKDKLRITALMYFTMFICSIARRDGLLGGSRRLREYVGDELFVQQDVIAQLLLVHALVGPVRDRD